MAQHEWLPDWTGDTYQLRCKECRELEADVGKLSDCAGAPAPAQPPQRETLKANPDWTPELSERIKADIEKMFGEKGDDSGSQAESL